MSAQESHSVGTSYVPNLRIVLHSPRTNENVEGGSGQPTLKSDSARRTSWEEIELQQDECLDVAHHLNQLPAELRTVLYKPEREGRQHLMWEIEVQQDKCLDAAHHLNQLRAELRIVLHSPISN